MGGVFKKPVQVAQQQGVVKPVELAPTTAEVSQSAATDADGVTDMRKIRRKGRSATILTSATGVEGSATLGTQSLLGG